MTQALPVMSHCKLDDAGPAMFHLWKGLRFATGLNMVSPSLLPSRLQSPKLHSLIIRSSTTIRLMSSSSSLNSAGLKPEESKSLEERQMQPREQSVIKAIKEMYSCKPNDLTFNIYSQNAVFHDPIGIATGIKGIRAQFMALANLFPRADIAKFRLLKNPPSVGPNTILIDQDVAYFRNPESSSPTKVVNSLLTIKLDNANKIQHHNEEWDHQKTITSEDGFFGMLNEARKKVTAKVTELFVGDKAASQN